MANGQILPPSVLNPAPPPGLPPQLGGAGGAAEALAMLQQGQAPTPAAPESTLSLGLQNLPVFQGVDPAAQRRALLATGLALLQPRKESQTQLGQISSSIGQGLASLDTERARQDTLAREEADRAILQQRADAATTGAEAQAASVEQSGDIAQQKLDEQVRQFNEQVDDRKAVRLLNEAKARLQDRLPEGGAGSITAPEVDLLEMKAKAATLFAADQAKPAGQRLYTSVDDPRLYDAAFSAVAIRGGQAGTENLAIVARSPEEAADLGATIQQIADPSVTAQAPTGAVAQQAKPTTQAEVDALPTGTTFVWTDGRTYTKQ